MLFSRENIRSPTKFELKCLFPHLDHFRDCAYSSVFLFLCKKLQLLATIFFSSTIYSFCPKVFEQPDFSPQRATNATSLIFCEMS